MILLLAIVLFALSTAYLAGFATASLFYFANVVLHMALGLGLAVVLGRRLMGAWGTTNMVLRLAWVLCAAGALTGVAIMIVGAAGPFRRLLPIHIALSLAGGVPLLAYAAGTRLRASGGRQRVVFGSICALLAVAAVGSATAAARSGAELRARYR